MNYASINSGILVHKELHRNNVQYCSDTRYNACFAFVSHVTCVKTDMRMRAKGQNTHAK